MFSSAGGLSSSCLARHWVISSYVSRHATSMASSALTRLGLTPFALDSSSSCATFSSLTSACHTLCARTSASE